MTDLLSEICYSIAGENTNTDADSILLELKGSVYCDKNDGRVISYMLDCSEKGQYPSEDYFNSIGLKKSIIHKTASELIICKEKILEIWKKNYEIRKINEITNGDNTTESLNQKLSDFLTEVAVDSEKSGDLDGFKPVVYTEVKERKITKGFMSGVAPIDEVTNGFQPGTVASIAAFTGGGKSTMLESILYKNASEGKKCLLFSIELPPEHVWLHLEARFMSEKAKLHVTTQDLIQGKIGKDDGDGIYDIIKENEDEFKTTIASNIMIVDESILTKAIVTDFHLMSNIWKHYEKKLGGLDIVAYDHVGQLELIFPELGNIAVRNITSATKTYENANGLHPATLLCVQVNREGHKRAVKNDGIYDLQAIADLNEVERSSSYCIFLYGTPTSTNEQCTFVSMLKHRLGKLVPLPQRVTFRPDIITVGGDPSVENGSFVKSFAGDFQTMKVGEGVDIFSQFLEKWNDNNYEQSKNEGETFFEDGAKLRSESDPFSGTPYPIGDFPF